MAPRVGESREDHLARRREEYRARVAADPEAYRAKARAQNRRYYVANAANERQRARQTYERRGGCTEDDRRRSREWRAANPDRVAKLNREWKAINREAVRCRRMTERARRLNAPGVGVSEPEWRQILNDFDYRCAYCGTSDCELTMDHVVPLVRGGRHAHENVVPACRPCNCRKHDLQVDLWFTRSFVS